MENEHGETLDDPVIKIKQLLTQAPTGDYGAVVSWQVEVRRLVDDLVIERIEPAFNARLAEMPQETLSDKQQLCRWVNAELRRLGLAIRCPKTGHAAILHADRGNPRQNGRFQVELMGKEFGRRSVSSPTLFYVHLTQEPTRVEPLAQLWSAKVSTSIPSPQALEGK